MFYSPGAVHFSPLTSRDATHVTVFEIIDYHAVRDWVVIDNQNSRRLKACCAHHRAAAECSALIPATLTCFDIHVKNFASMSRTLCAGKPAGSAC